MIYQNLQKCYVIEFKLDSGFCCGTAHPRKRELKIAGKSHDVIENKQRGDGHFDKSHNVHESKRVMALCHDVYDKKGGY